MSDSYLFDRELQEEAGAIAHAPQAFGALAKPDNHEVMLSFVSDGFRLGDFSPKADALAREAITPNELARRYHGDRRLLTIGGR